MAVECHFLRIYHCRECVCVCGGGGFLFRLEMCLTLYILPYIILPLDALYIALYLVV